MAEYAKLKNDLPINIPRQVTILERLGEEQGNYGPQWKYKLSFDGKQYTHWATSNEEQSLSLFKPGEQVQVAKRPATRPGTYWLEWTPTEGAEARAAANPQVRSNTAQTKVDREYDDHQKEKLVHDYKLGLAGIVQAMLIRGSSESEIVLGIGDEGRECKSAEQWAEWIRTKASEMASRTDL